MAGFTSDQRSGTNVSVDSVSVAPRASCVSLPEGFQHPLLFVKVRGKERNNIDVLLKILSIGRSDDCYLDVQALYERIKKISTKSFLGVRRPTPLLVGVNEPFKEELDFIE